MSADPAVRVGRGTAVNWTAWILARALALATLLMLARSLGADELGALLAALAAGILGAALASGGLADATARQAAAAGGPTSFGRGDVMRALRRFAVVLPLILVAVIAITARSSEGIGLSELIAASLLAVSQGATMITASVFRARNQPGRFALATNLASSGGRAVIALGALVLDLPGGAVLWSFALLNIAVAALTWRPAVLGLPDTTTSVEGMGALQLGGVVWSLLGNLDVVIVGLLLGAGPAGTYSVSLRVAEFSAQFVLAIGLFFLPEATRLVVTGQRDRLIGLYRAACRWSALTTLPAAGIGFIAAPEIAQIVFPDDPETTTELLRILFAGYAVQGALGVSYATLTAVGAYGAITSSSVVAVPLLLAGTLALTEAWELVGAASATVMGYVGLSLWWTKRTAEELGTTPFDARYVRVLAACVPSWAAAALTVLLLPQMPAVAALAATSAAGLAACLAALALVRAFTPTERELLSLVLLPGRRGDRRGRVHRPVSRG